MAMEDARQTRQVHHELSRRYVDFSKLEVRVIHGVCYINGEMKHLRSHPDVNLDHEADVIRQCVIRMSGIRDVVWNVRHVQ